MNTDEKIKYVNEIFYLKKEIKKLKAILKKICRTYQICLPILWERGN